MLGAKSTWRIVERLEVWRLLAAVFLHGGLLHLLGNVTAILAYGRCAPSRRMRPQRGGCEIVCAFFDGRNVTWASPTSMSAIWARVTAPMKQSVWRNGRRTGGRG
jgi:hypothetical protein